jgi:hypothetical protein
MQEPGRRPFAGVDLRRPKGYPAADSAAPADAETATEAHGDPCPRCESRDTKFCYYNNYNTSQPRHYCKSCRRYWTKGGSLRNVPVGGGSRKATSSSSSSTSASASPRRAKNSKRRRIALAAPPEAEPEPSTVGDPATDVHAARAAANGTIGDPTTAVDAARTGAARTEAAANNGTIGNPASAEATAQTEATAYGAVHDPAIAVDSRTTEAASTEDVITADDPGAHTSGANLCDVRK